MAWRTNNNLKMQFKVNDMNQLTNVSRTGAMTVFGALASRTGTETVTVSGTGLGTTAADLYTDAAWASQNGATLADGVNTWTAKIVDNGVTNQQVVTAYMPASPNFTYDGNGNLTNDGLRTLEYDFENQLTNLFVANGWRSEFQYDGLGRRRVRKEYTWSGGAWSLTNEVRYVYGRLVLQERDGSNNPTVTYTRGLDLSGTLEGAGGIGGLLARSDSGGNAFYHSDPNGNVLRLVKYSGGNWQLAAFYRYDPYGNILAMTGPLAAANLYRFSSKEAHPNSGLVYYLYRYYDPNLQRWVNRDPIGEDGALNLHQFVSNSPIDLIDSFGWEVEVSPACRADYDKAKAYLAKSDTATKFIERLEKDPKTKYYVDRIDDGDHGFRDGRVKWDPRAATKSKEGTQTPALALVHELKHAEIPGKSLEEDDKVIDFQNQCAKELGEDPRQGHVDWEFVCTGSA